MSSSYVAAWALAFAMTQLCEVPIYLWFLRTSTRPRRERFAIAFAASAITHPLVWFVAPSLISGTHFFVVVEVLVVAVEALWLAALDVRRALPASVVANVVSAGLGLLLQPG